MAKKNPIKIPKQVMVFKKALQTSTEEFVREVYRFRGMAIRNHVVYIYQKGYKGTAYYNVSGNMLYEAEHYVEKTFCLWPERTRLFVFFDDDGKCWGIQKSVGENGHLSYNVLPVNKIYNGFYTFVINSREQLLNTVRKQNKYLYEFCTNKEIRIDRIILCPSLEILCKAGYRFAKNIAESEDFYKEWRHWVVPDEHLDMFNRLCRYNGKNPREIFKTPKKVYETLKNEDDLVIWENIRKMVNNNPDMTKEAVRGFYDYNLSGRDTKVFYEVVMQKYHGKRVFTVSSLLAYLNRINVYEAILPSEGLPILRDYIRACNVIGMEPKIDGDSLKREHDIAARASGEIIQREKAGAFEEACRKNARYDYEEDIFFARSIRTLDDLADERNQQHNCVMCYVDDIARGKTAIFVARYKKSPDRSLATVEVTEGKIVQKYLAYNAPIRNRSLMDFLKRWQKHITETYRQDMCPDAVV